MATSNTNQWQPSPVVQALQHAVQFPRTSPSWFDILYPRKEERPVAPLQPPQAEARQPVPVQPQPQNPGKN